MSEPVRLRFGPFELNFRQRTLLRDGQPIPLGSRAFDVLSVLAQRRDREVSKAELLDLAWPGLVVEENNLQVQVSTLRKLLGPQAITTIPGRGYRFGAEVDVTLDGGAPTVHADSVESATPARSHAAQIGNLPARLPPLFGRDEERAEIQQLLGPNALVTVVGAGGIGKTSLAVAAVHAFRDKWRDGVWVVDLAPVSERAKIAVTVAQTVGIASRDPDVTPEAIATVLQSQSMLLLLDNCEHLVEEVARFAAAILAHAPGVQLLTTSQQPLNVHGEHVFNLHPLAVPAIEEQIVDESLGAIRLFAERARAVDRRFAIGPTNAAAVADLCRRLDGLPLAIELAAARVRQLGVQGLRDRLGERFRLLTAGSRFALRRHQTLHAALDWSHGLLSAEEQAVLRRVAVFAGGWTLEAAEQLASDDRIDEWAVLEHLAALVDKSMVVVHGGETPRYTLLETTRAYALEKLAQAGETESLVKRHAQVMLAVFGRADEERFGEQSALSDTAHIERVQRDFDNLRAALEWATGDGGDEALAIALAAASAEAFYAAGLAAEGLAVLRALMPRVTTNVDDVISARFWFAVASVCANDRIEDGAYVQALEHAEQGCRRHQWQRRLYLTLLCKAWRHISREEIVAGEAALAEAVSMERPHWPGWLRSERWNTQVKLIEQTRAFEDAPAVFETIATLLPRQGEERRRRRLAGNTVAHWNHRQQWDRVVSLVDDLHRQRGHQMDGWDYGHLVQALTQLGRLDDAQQRLRQAMPLWRANAIVHVWLHVAIRLAVAQGRIADAVRLVGAEDASPSQYGRQNHRAAYVRAESLRLIEAAAMDPAQRERWQREGASLDEAAIVALCLGEAGAAPPT